jgi:hypothetical protein
MDDRRAVAQELSREAKCHAARTPPPTIGVDDHPAVLSALAVLQRIA